MGNCRDSYSTLNSQSVSSNSTPDMWLWMCYYLLSLISLSWLRGTPFFLVIYGNMPHTYYIVFQMQRKILLIAIFLGQAFLLLQKSKKYLLKSITMWDHFPEWEPGIQPELKLLTAKLQHISCNTCAVHVTLKIMIFDFVRNWHEIMSVFSSF